MLILTIRTDNPKAELGLYQASQPLACCDWQADRQLAETIHLKIKELLDSQNLKLNELQGIVAYQGPGSFTGLRIGLTVANALGDSLQVPIVGETGEGWQQKGCQKIEDGQNQKVITPEYGSPPHITPPKK